MQENGPPKFRKSYPTIFHLKDYPEAKSVYLTGNFENQIAGKQYMTQIPDGWMTSLDLLPGSYEYHFTIVKNSGKKKKLPPRIKKVSFREAKIIAKNSSREANNDTDARKVMAGEKILVPLKVRVPDARNVVLAGEFNHWDGEALSMKQGPAGKWWILIIPLKTGKYKYRYVVGANWNSLNKSDRVIHADPLKKYFPLSISTDLKITEKNFGNYLLKKNLLLRQSENWRIDF